MSVPQGNNPEYGLSSKTHHTGSFNKLNLLKQQQQQQNNSKTKENQGWETVVNGKDEKRLTRTNNQMQWVSLVIGLGEKNYL